MIFNRFIDFIGNERTQYLFAQQLFMLSVSVEKLMSVTDNMSIDFKCIRRIFAGSIVANFVYRDGNRHFDHLRLLRNLHCSDQIDVQSVLHEKQIDLVFRSVEIDELKARHRSITFLLVDNSDHQQQEQMRKPSGIQWPECIKRR